MVDLTNMNPCVYNNRSRIYSPILLSGRTTSFILCHSMNKYFLYTKFYRNNQQLFTCNDKINRKIK